MKERSLSGILISAIMIVVLISISFTSGITYLLLKRHIEREFREKFKVQRHQAKSLLSLRISQLKGRLRNLINDNTIKVTLLLGVIPQLRERMEMLYFPENGAYFYVEGTIERDKLIIPSPSELHKELIKRILSTDKEMELFESFKGRPLLLLSKTIERRYEKVGRAVCLYFLDQDRGLLKDIRLTARGEIYYRSGKRDAIGLISGKRIILPDNSHLIEDAVEVEVGEKKGLISKLDIFSGLLLFSDLSPLEKTKKEVLLILLSLSIAALSLGIGIALILAKRLSNPLKLASERAQKISEGEYNLDLPPPDEMPYLELKVMTQAFNRMLNSLRKALEESESFYKAIFEASGTGLTIVDKDTTILLCNKVFEKLSGYRREEIEGKMSLTEFVHPDDRERMLEYARLRRIDPSMAPHEYEFRFLDKEKNLKNVFISVGMIPGTKKNIASLLDITPIKKIQEALRESERRFRELFESSKDVIYVYKDGEGFLEMNPAGEELFGYSRNKFRKIKFQKLFLDPKECIKFEEGIKRKGFVKDFEAALKGNGERIIEALITATEFRDEKGNIIGHRGIIIDLTERKRLQLQLFQAQKMEAIGTLAGGIAHDFNNILNAILGYAELLLMDKGRSEQDINAIKQIKNAALKASELTKQILTFSRKAELKLSPIDLNMEIRGAVKLIERTIPKIIGVELKLSESLPLIRGDSIQIEQILLNLAINSRDAMPEGGKITIETKYVSLDEEISTKIPGIEKGDYVMLKVSDTGCGMDRETMSRIFEPFFSTKPEGKGTGLGLSTVYGIVKAHGGHITVDSMPGVGTTFKIYFPVIKGENGEISQKDIEENASVPYGKETILFVDDEESLLKLGKEVLCRYGYKVITAENGKKALEIYQREKVDLVILDLIMPEMDGKECLKRLSEIDPDIKVILSTGYSIGEMDLGKEGIYIKGIIRKPFNLKEMLKEVRRVLDRN